MGIEIALPRLVGTRASAHVIVKSAFGSKRSTAVTLRARAVLNAAPSFVDELIKLLIDRGVTQLEVVGESEDLRQQIIDANARHGSKLKLSSELVPQS